jgi:predicted amidohydrolase YtcJ
MRLTLLVILCAAWDSPDEPSKAPASAIYYNGIVETLDGSFHRAEAVAVKGTRILDIGSSARLLAAHRRPGTKLIDLGGRTVLPGFVDSHTHVFNDFESAGLTLEQMQEEVLRRGITTIGNPTIGPGILRLLQAFAASGQLVVRTSLYLAYNGPCGDVLDVPAPEWYLALEPVTDPDAILRLEGVKIFTDGGACNSPAETFLYPDDEGALTYGDLYFDQATLDPLVARADAAGWQVLLHSLGDGSHDVAMHAIADALDGQPNRLRHRIDHNVFVHPDQIAFYQQAGIVPVVFTGIGTCAYNAGTSIANWLPPEDRSWAAPNRTMLEARLPIAWHGDWRRGQPLEIYQPFHYLFNFVTRTGIDSDGSLCYPPDWLAAEAITIPQALRMMTLSAAYALRMDRFVGSLEVRKLADMIIIDEDPLEADPVDIKDMTVDDTIIGGQARYCGASFPLPCQ